MNLFLFVWFLLVSGLALHAAYLTDKYPDEVDLRLFPLLLALQVVLVGLMLTGMLT